MEGPQEKRESLSPSALLVRLVDGSSVWMSQVDVSTTTVGQLQALLTTQRPGNVPVSNATRRVEWSFIPHTGMKPVVLSTLDETRSLQDLGVTLDGTIVLSLVPRERTDIPIGEVFTWGMGTSGQLGTGDLQNAVVPRRVENLYGRPVRALSCGDQHCTALTLDREVFTWGSNEYGQLGHGTKDPEMVTVPTLIEWTHPHNIHGVVCGPRQSGVMTGEGELFVCGNGWHGELGLGTNDDCTGFQHVEALQGCRVAQLSWGGSHAACITYEGDVFAWGCAWAGATASMESTDQWSPRRVESLRQKGQARQVACGGHHTIILMRCGDVYTFGRGDYGQLGHSDDRHSNEPQLVKGLRWKGIQSVAAGAFHSLAVTTSGVVYAWGSGDYGQLGHGSDEHQSTPSRVRSLEVTKVVAHGDGSAAVTKTGNLYIWGTAACALRSSLNSIDEWDLLQGTLLPTHTEALTGKFVTNVDLGLCHVGVLSGYDEENAALVRELTEWAALFETDGERQRMLQEEKAKLEKQFVSHMCSRFLEQLNATTADRNVWKERCHLQEDRLVELEARFKAMEAHLADAERKA